MMENIEEVHAAIQQICDEKNISLDAVVETIEAALAAAYRKDFGEKNQNIKVEFSLTTGDMKVFDVKTVVEDVDLELQENEIAKQEERRQMGEEITDEESIKRFNPRTELMLAEAKVIKPDVELNEEIWTKLEIPSGFGRMAAQTAKQVIIQRLREAERQTVFDEFKDREGRVMDGVVQRKEGRLVFVDIGRAMAIMPVEEQIPTEAYKTGQRLKFYVVSVNLGNRGAEIIVSRAHEQLVRTLFSIEVPEISTGVVEIKSVAREAGLRTKIAVTSAQENIDPIGSCVGQRGARVQTIINELAGEKIDIIEWNEDAKIFIANSLSPAKISSLEIFDEEKLAHVFVAEDQLSLAIGKGGQNVRLAAKLTGWKIDIDGAQEFLEKEAEVEEVPATEEVENSEAVIEPVADEAEVENQIETPEVVAEVEDVEKKENADTESVA
jgi:N utilization substance protein A